MGARSASAMNQVKTDENQDNGAAYENTNIYPVRTMTQNVTTMALTRMTMATSSTTTTTRATTTTRTRTTTTTTTDRRLDVLRAIFLIAPPGGNFRDGKWIKYEKGAKISA